MNENKVSPEFLRKAISEDAMAFILALPADDDRVQRATDAIMDVLKDAGVVEADRAAFYEYCKSLDHCPCCEGMSHLSGFDGWVLWQRPCPVCAGTGRFWPTQER